MSHRATMTDGSEKTYLTCAETAKLVRGALKTAFPGVTFSVRSSTYSGGASITVGWTDGPRSTVVDEVIGIFSGADFDGMVDLKVDNTHWLHPDGTVTLARRPGTTGSFAEIIGDPSGPTAQLVSFGADFIFAQRDISPEFQGELVALVEFDTGRPFEPNGYYEKGIRIPDALGCDRSFTSPGYGNEQIYQLSVCWDRQMSAAS